MTRRKILLIALPLFILLCGLGTYFFISSEYFLENIIKTRLIKALDNQINEGYEVKIGKLYGNVLTSIDVEDFTIKEENSEKPNVLSTKKITLKYNFFGLLRRKFLVTALEIDAPKIEVLRNLDGQVNLTQVLRKTPLEPESNNSFAFAVSNVLINSGEIHFTDTQQKLELSLPNINIQLGGKLEKWDHSGTFSIDNGSFALNGTTLPIERLKDVKFAISAKSGELEPLQLKLGNSFLDVKQFRRNWDNGQWNTLLELSINAEDVQKFLSYDTQLAGSGKVVLDLHGTNSTLDGKLTVRSNTLSIKQILVSPTHTSESNDRQIDIAELSIDTSLELAEVPKVTLDKFSVQIADGKLTGNGSATFDNTVEGNLLTRIQHFVLQPITYDSNWQISDIQLHSFLSMFLELPTESPQIQSGSLSGTAQIKGDAKRNFHLESGVALSETSLLVKGKTKPVLLNASSLNCEINSEQDKGSNITAEGVLDDAKVDIIGSFEHLDVKIDNVDFGKICKIVNTIPFKGTGSITAQIKKDGTATGYVEIPKTSYGEFTPPISLGSITGNFRYTNQIVYFENAQLVKKGETGDTKVSFEGDVKIENKLPTNFSIVANPLVLDPDYNQLFFQQAFPIKGIIKGEVKLYGFLINHLDGEGKFSVDSGNAWNINLDPLTLLLEVDDYSLTIPNFEITSRGQQVFFNAHVTNKGEFDFSLKNPNDKPIQLAEVALAADLTDFPLDGKLDIKVDSYKKLQEDFVFEVEYNFSDLSFENNPLGNTTLFSILVEENQLTGESAFFKFTGEAFEGTCSIEGKIINTKDNPYQFILNGEEMVVSPILRIFDKRLEAISGTADGIVTVEGTLTELTTEPEDPSTKRIYPYDVNITINKTHLECNSVHFTNPKPIHMLLEDDLLTIVDSSLAVRGENSSFVNLTGYFNYKNAEINISAKSDEYFDLKPLGLAFNTPISGSGYYQIKTIGPLSDPIVELKWGVPSLVVDSDIAEIRVSDVQGELKYQDNVVSIKPFNVQVMENLLQVGGTITVNQNEFNNSGLNLNIIGENLNLEKFSELIRKSLSRETLTLLTHENTPLIEGTLDISLNLGGSIAEPSINLNAHTAENHPIKFGAIAKPITLQKLHAITTVRKKSLQIQDLVANGGIGTGSFQINGNTSFSTQNRDEMKFDLDASVQKLDVGDVVKLIHQNPFFLTGILSGSVKITGNGLTPDYINGSCKIDELNLQSHNYYISNTSPLDFKLENNNVISHIPLQITSPAFETIIDARIDGTLTSPNISVQLEGMLNHPQQSDTNFALQLQGNVGYTNKQIKLGIILTDNDNDLTLNGTIPFDLTISDVGLSERFTDVPINVTLSGQELPLTFFPGLVDVFSEVEGVSDINLIVQGTYPNPHLQGNVSIEAPHLRLKKFHQSFQNVNIKLNAGKDSARNDVIELTKFEFNIEEGEVSLQQHSKLLLEGLTPKSIELNGLTINDYPLGSFLSQAIPNELIQDVDGNLTATLKQLNIPLDSFFEDGEIIPIPKLPEQITIDALTQIATADFRIDDITLGFSALDQPFSFVNPSPIPITLNKGEFIVAELKLENTASISSNETQIPMVFSSFGSWNMRGGMRLNLKLSNFDVSVLDPLFSDINLDTYKLRGMVTTAINITNTYEEPEINVRFEGHNLIFNDANIDEFSGKIYYSSTDKQWSISESAPAILKAGRNQLTYSGNVPYLLSFTNLQAEPIIEPMEVKFTLKLDEFGILSDIEPFIESAQGVGTIIATVYGTPNAPQLKGAGELNAVSLNIAGSPLFIDNTDVQFAFSESQLNIESITGILNDGNFFASGYLDSEWFKVNNIDLNVSLDNCSFIEPGQYRTTLSTGADDLHLYGNIDKSIQTNLTLTGDIIIHSGDYEQNWENVQDWFSGATVSQVEVTFGNTILNNLQLDIGIEIPGHFSFLTSLGGATVIKIKCSGRLTGLIQEPIFVGDITLFEGRISTVTQVFEIVEGSSIRNQNTSDFNPDLNINLKLPNPIRGVLLEDGSTTDVMVRVAITGTLHNNKPTYVSELLNSSTTEILTEVDVLALLLPGNSISRSFGGITITVLSGFDADERHIIAEYPLPNNMSIKVEGDKNDFGVDIQLLERRF